MFKNLDDRTKLLGLIVLSFGPVSFSNHSSLIVIVIIVSLLWVSDGKGRLLLRRVPKIVAFLLFLFLILVGPKLLRGDEGSIGYGITMSLRYFSMLLSAQLAVLSIPDIGEAIRQLFRFKRRGVIIEGFALVFGLAFQLIPSMGDEIKLAMERAKSRGIDIDSGGRISRAKNMLTLALPILLNANQIADRVAISHKIYRYDVTTPRSSFRVMVMRYLDWAFFLAIIALFVGLKYLTQ